MKKIFLLIFLFFLLISAYAQKINNKNIHTDFGEWILDAGENQVGISSFVTVEEHFQVTEAKNEKRKEKNDSLYTTLKTYKFELYLESKSIYEGDSTKTWIYGARIFINDNEITKDKFPDGFIFLIDNKPTLVYQYESKTKKDVNFHITWDKAIYENRTEK